MISKVQQKLRVRWLLSWGLSDKLGPLTYGQEEGEVFLGHSVTRHKEFSEETANSIDQEVRTIIERNYALAKSILEGNLDKLHKMAEALIKYETLDSKQIDAIMEGRDPDPPVGWDDKSSSGTPTAPATATEGSAKGTGGTTATSAA